MPFSSILCLFILVVELKGGGSVARGSAAVPYSSNLFTEWPIEWMLILAGVSLTSLLVDLS